MIQGELFVGDWSPEAGDRLKLTLGPSSKKPLHIPLVEMKTDDAASYATTVFLDIALQAQSRKCHLNAAPFASASRSPPPPLPTPVRKAPAAASPKSAAAKATAPISTAESKAQEEIKALKAELLEQKRRKLPAEPVEKASALGALRPPKGASLANPNKKARKYQALEFESDDE
jgi:hypothetical protein